MTALSVNTADRLAGLGAEFKLRRSQCGLSLRAVAAELVIGFNSLSRLEHGKDVHLSTAIAVLRWLDQPQMDAS